MYRGNVQAAFDMACKPAYNIYSASDFMYAHDIICNALRLGPNADEIRQVLRAGPLKPGASPDQVFLDNGKPDLSLIHPEYVCQLALHLQKRYFDMTYWKQSDELATKDKQVRPEMVACDSTTPFRSNNDHGTLCSPGVAR